MLPSLSVEIGTDFRRDTAYDSVKDVYKELKEIIVSLDEDVLTEFISSHHWNGSSVLRVRPGRRMDVQSP